MTIMVLMTVLVMNIAMTMANTHRMMPTMIILIIIFSTLKTVADFEDFRK